MGFLLLAGGAEFGGHMAVPDERAIALAGGAQAPIRIIPTAAAPDNNHERAGNNAVRWFSGLGAGDVRAVPLIDDASANDAAIADELRAARLIYMLGGFPAFLGQTLAGSASWAALQAAHGRGAVLAGSSAGAMVLCEFFFDPQGGTVVPGLGMLPGCCVLPHHNTFGRGWATRLAARIPDATLLGIDERTAMLDDGADGSWGVYGAGVVTLYRAGQPSIQRAGEWFSL